MLAIVQRRIFFLSSNLVSKNLKIKVCRIIILPVAWHGCETWSLTLREERRLRVFGNRVLRRKFGPKRDEVTGKWRKLLNEELSDLYFSTTFYFGDQINKMGWVLHVACVGERRGACRFLVGKPEG